VCYADELVNRTLCVVDEAEQGDGEREVELAVRERKPSDVGLEQTRLGRLQARRHEHLGVRVHTGDLEAVLEQATGVDPGAAARIERSLTAAQAAQLRDRPPLC
jgi:hypothetical protein